MTDLQLDALRRMGEELRQLFAEERRAIANLDHDTLERVAKDKTKLVGLLTAAVPEKSPEVRALFHAIRVEARANAELAAAATAAVRTLLGYEQTGASYDRRARKLTADPTRNLTAL
jgi:hypothetical protein